MGRIIQVKISKGGVGKTFLTIQIASLLAALDKKVLILTTDPQNDVFGMMKKGEITEEISNRGLKEAVLHNEKAYDLILLRKNLFYIPLDFDGYFSPEFFKRLPAFLEEQKKEYDYVFIDSNPTPKTDKEFLKIADYIIIPTIGSARAVRGVVSVLENVDPNKILAIVFNQFKNTRLQKEVYEELKNSLEELGLSDLLLKPIPYVALIEELVAREKNIWESKSKKIKPVQDIIISLVKNILMRENY